MNEQIKLAVKQKNGKVSLVAMLRDDYETLDIRCFSIKVDFYFLDKPDVLLSKRFHSRAELNDFLKGKWDIVAEYYTESGLRHNTKHNKTPSVLTFRDATLKLLDRYNKDIEELNQDILNEIEEHKERVSDLDKSIVSLRQKIETVLTTV